MKSGFGHGRKRGAALLAALFLMLPTALPSAAEERTVLRVAFPQSEGYTMTAPDGRRYGLVVDFLNEIAKYTGWQYEFVDVDNNSMVDRFLAGDFDLAGGTYYADSFTQYFAYPEYSCGYSQITLLAREDDKSIKSYDLGSFSGKTISVFERNHENIRRLQAYLEINALDCTLRTYTYEELMVTGNLNRFLESGEVDLLLGNSTDTRGDFVVAATFDSQPHYIVTTPGNQEVLDGLNMALARIYEADPLFAEKRYAANFTAAETGSIRLSEEEKAYVAEKETVSVAVPYNWHPMICLNNNDSHDGFVSDVLGEIAGYSGLRFSYIYCDSYAESVRAVQRGEADMLGFFLGTEKDAMDQGLALSAAYVEMDSILVRNKESGYPEQGLTGGVMEGRVMPEGIVADEVRYYSDTAKALADVNRGKIDFYYGLAFNLEYIIQQHNFTNVMQVNLINDSLEMGFALAKPADASLLSILNKAINSLTDEQKAVITSRNIISIGNTRLSLSSILYGNPTLAISVVSVFLLLILATVIIISRARLHAAVMRGELEKAEAESRAKSDFLSKMSHEIRTPMNAIVGLTDLTGMMEGLPEKARENLSKIKSSSRYLLELINDILDMSRIENGKMDMAAEPFSLGGVLNEIENMMLAEADRRQLHFHMEEDIRDDELIGDAIRLRQVLLILLSNAFKFTPSGGTVRLCVSEDASSEKDAVLTFRVIDTGVGIAAEDQKRVFGSFEQLGPNSSKSQGTGLGLAISQNIVERMGGELKLNSRPGAGSEFYFTIALPRGRVRHPAAADTSPGGEMFRGAHILVVEDNDINAQIVTELLQAQGASVTRAKNGKEALAVFQNTPPGGFQAVLMDIRMPEMNGLEAARAIRALEHSDAPAVPIIAMTANAFREDMEMAGQAGMTGFVPKPIDVHHLYEVLRGALAKGDGVPYMPINRKDD